MWKIQNMRPWLLAITLAVVALSLPDDFAQAGFVDQTAQLAPPPPPINLGKAAWADFNNDGFADLINHDSGRVWTNLGGTGFSSNANGGSGGVMADYDNDGLLDIYYYGLNLLSLNSSTQVTTSFAYQPILPAVPMWDAGENRNRSNGACWADFNNDAHVDVYVGGYEIWSTVSGYLDAVLWNNQGASFTTSGADHYNQNPTRGVTACDWDRDGDMDIYASNYRLVANQLLRNDGGSFTNVAGTHNATGGSGHSIGSAWGDIDNDGDFDLFAGNFAHDKDFFGPGSPPVRQPESRFLENLGSGASPPYSFDDKGTGGVTWQESYASPALGDYDNDGNLDLFFTTADPGDHCVLYRNEGNWTFTDVTGAEGLSGLANTKQAAWADFDNDGDLDLATTGRIFVNTGNANHWLKVHLTGDGTTINRGAIGAEVRIDLGGGQILTRQVEAGTGEGNQNDLTLHFGLGGHAGPVDLEITAGGATGTVTGVSVDRRAEYTLSITGESDTWEGSYEADVFPPVDNWISDGDQSIAASGSIVPDGGNNYISNGPTGLYENVRSLNYVASSWTNGGASFEIRGRVLGGGTGDSVLGHVMTTAEAEDPHYYWLTYYIENGAIKINNSNSFANDNATVSLDITQWHTYRFTMDGTHWKLYIDGASNPAATLVGLPDASEPIPFNGYFGWFWAMSADADLDYLRYTDSIPDIELAIAAVLPTNCGDIGTTYKQADMNNDCYVNEQDLVQFTDAWLTCTDPQNPCD